MGGGWGDHEKLIHLAQGDFKCSSPSVGSGCPHDSHLLGVQGWLRGRGWLEVKQMEIHSLQEGAACFSRQGLVWAGIHLSKTREPHGAFREWVKTPELRHVVPARGSWGR